MTISQWLIPERNMKMSKSIITLTPKQFDDLTQKYFNQGYSLGYTDGFHDSEDTRTDQQTMNSQDSIENEITHIVDSYAERKSY